MDRRAFLACSGLGAVSWALAGCSEDAPVREPDGAGDAGDAGEVRHDYGEDPSQYGELYLPSGSPRGVVVVIHGGFWLSQYDLSLGAPLATSLAAEGWAAWNLEYRRVGNGGGFPETLDDIAAGIDKLADLGLDLSTVVTLGHSAGGHLAAWAASRGRFDQWAGGVDVTAVISQAGVLDLQQGYDDGLGGGAVEGFLGQPPGPDTDSADPAKQLPLEVPVWAVHGTDDTIVPPSQSADYVAAATAAGAEAELVEVEGDHFVVIDATSPAWARQLEILGGLGGR